MLNRGVSAAPVTVRVRAWKEPQKARCGTHVHPLGFRQSQPIHLSCSTRYALAAALTGASTCVVHSMMHLARAVGVHGGTVSVEVQLWHCPPKAGIPCVLAQGWHEVLRAVATCTHTLALPQHAAEARH